MSGEVQIAIYTEIHEAEIARGLLTVNGVASRIVRDDAGAMYPQLHQGLGVRLVVPSEFAVQARRILEEAQADARPVTRATPRS
jgi:hypothetical protein